MRLTTMTAGALIAVASFGAAQAADINQQGAQTLQDNLTLFLPEKMAKSGVVQVSPAGDRYRITYDFSKLLAEIDTKMFTVEGLKPLDMYASPIDGGMWNVEGNNSFDISGHIVGENGPATEFNYSIGSIISKSVFDPAITYFRSGDFTAKNIKISSTTGTEKVNGSFSEMAYKMAATDNNGGKTTDISSTGSMTGFSEEVVAGTAAPVTIKADRFDFDANVKGFVIKEFRDFIVFMLEHGKDDHFTPEQGDKFKALIRSAMPLLSSIDEDISVSNLTVSGEQGDVTVGKVGYGLQMDGLTNAAHLGFNIRAENIGLASGMIPETYTQFVPDVAEVQFGIGGMNFAGAIDAALTQADFSKESPLTEAQGDEIAKLILPDGVLKMDFPKISAKSPIYDIEVSGTIVGHIDQPDRYKLEASILARDYDKSIEAVQDAAKSDPQLAQVSFGMMMVKGFAKTDPDGRQRWDVQVDEDGTVTVNGQIMKSGAN